MYKFYSSDHYQVQLAENHKFPMAKYQLLKESLVSEKIITIDQLVASEPADKNNLYLAHDKEYVDHVLNLTLPAKRARPVGLPLNKEMVTRALVSLSSSLLAAEKALEVNISGALSSGTHHASTDQGAGFCYFNDFAIIARKYSNKKILIVDLDVHQGNGNGEILKSDPHVKIVDIYCENNYPFKKQFSPDGFNIGLPRGTRDDAYLSTLEQVLRRLDTHFDLILYQAGVDILEHDHLGHFDISFEGVAMRDQMIFEWAASHEIPISFVIGGGYAKDISQTVKANKNTFLKAKEIFGF
ncbi:MAG: histone deacetylase [Halobacteriovoraceae bacterium]|nr:histone deacetylase [Halobacteriovoraceae bacterium]|tara:strand:- start:11437 stop:12330 length:894 start_codon:yes stop_codon:yes gene_type:complete